LDSGKWTILTPILVAIIPVAASILTAFYSAPNVNEPVVTIAKWNVPNSDSKEGIIQIKNIGRGPATNMTVYIESKSIIVNVSQVSPFRVTLPGFNNSVLPMYSPKTINNKFFQFSTSKFVQGEGAFIDIYLTFKESQEIEDLVALAIYDQGSALAKIVHSFFGEYMWLYLTLAVIGEVIYAIYLFTIRRRKITLRNLHSNFLMFRRAILDRPDNRESFRLKWLPKKPEKPEKKSFNWKFIFGHNRSGHSDRYYSRHSWDNALKNSRKYVKDISDYIKVEDALASLSKREESLNLEKIRDLNNRLLGSINNALQSVNWDRYM
jgi:hypothetical protein